MELSAIAAPDGAVDVQEWVDGEDGVHRRRVLLDIWIGDPDYMVEVAALQIAKYDDNPGEIVKHFMGAPMVQVWTGDADHACLQTDSASQVLLASQQVAQAADILGRFHDFGVDVEMLQNLADDLLRAGNYLSDYQKWER